MPELRYVATLRAFADGTVDFILVGGLAAVLNGLKLDAQKGPVDMFLIDSITRPSEN